MPRAEVSLLATPLTPLALDSLRGLGRGHVREGVLWVVRSLLETETHGRLTLTHVRWLVPAVVGPGEQDSAMALAVQARCGPVAAASHSQLSAPPASELAVH